MMLQTEKYNGPIYIRLGRGGDKIITDRNSDVQIGKAVQLVKPFEKVFITTGITTQIALDAIKTLEKENIKVGLIHLNTSSL